MKNDINSFKAYCQALIIPEKTVANIPTEIEPMWEYISQCMDTLSGLISTSFIDARAEKQYARILQQIADDLLTVMTEESRNKILQWMSSKVQTWHDLALEEEYYEAVSNLNKLLKMNIITYNAKSNAPRKV